MSVLLLIWVCLPSTTLAQQKQVAGHRVVKSTTSTIDYRLTRVLDPLSKNTQWIDNYITHSNTLTEGTQPDGTDVVQFRFRVNSIVFEKNYMDNAQSLALIHRMFADSTQQKTTLTLITGSASPEGYSAENKLLAANRALAIKSYIMNQYPTTDRDKIATYSIGEDWVGLRQLVQKENGLQGKRELLAILDLTLSDTQKLRKIKELNRGKVYKYLSDNILPLLRGGVTCTFYCIPNTSQAKEPIIEYRDRVVEKIRIDTLYIDRSSASVPILPTVEDKIPTLSTEKKKDPFFFVIKTNMLYDAVLLPNLAIEMPIANRWSLEMEGMESWWNTKDDKPYKHRIQTLGLELRKWLGKSSTKSPLTGYFFGLYGMGGTYDIKTQRQKGSLSNWTYSAGITYGYAMPIARRFNLEFAIGIGYVAGEYKNYTYDSERNCYTQVTDFSRSYVGPTKAKISLVWLIGTGGRINTKR